MRGLAAARSDWDRIEAEETRLLREMTLEEGSRQWLRLQEAFAGQLEETEALFGPERRTALIELQARLYKLKLWLESHEEPVPINRGDPGPSRQE